MASRVAETQATFSIRYAQRAYGVEGYKIPRLVNHHATGGRGGGRSGARQGSWSNKRIPSRTHHFQIATCFSPAPKTRRSRTASAPDPWLPRHRGSVIFLLLLLPQPLLRAADDRSEQQRARRPFSPALLHQPPPRGLPEVRRPGSSPVQQHPGPGAPSADPRPVGLVVNIALHHILCYGAYYRGRRSCPKRKCNKSKLAYLGT